MKIALCFHGLPRLINECYSDIINYFINNCKKKNKDIEVDVYAHFWWDEKYKGKVNRLHVPEKYDPTENPIEIFTDLYKPEKIIYEECPIDFDANNFNIQGYNTDNIKNDDLYSKLMASILLYGLYCRFLSATKVLKLFQNNSKNYDLVIICRTDLLTFNKNTDLISELNQIHDINLDKFIYFPSTMEGGIKYAGEHPNRLGDWLFMGNFNNVYTYCSKIEDIFKNNELYNGICPLHNTERLTHWGEIANIKIEKYNSSISIRRFQKEEWEDESYRKSKMIPHTFYVTHFDKINYHYQPSDLLPFYINNIKFIKD